MFLFMRILHCQVYWEALVIYVCFYYYELILIIKKMLCYHNENLYPQLIEKQTVQMD